MIHARVNNSLDPRYHWQPYFGFTKGETTSKMSKILKRKGDYSDKRSDNPITLHNVSLFADNRNKQDTASVRSLVNAKKSRFSTTE